MNEECEITIFMLRNVDDSNLRKIHPAYALKSSTLSGIHLPVSKACDQKKIYIYSLATLIKGEKMATTYFEIIAIVFTRQSLNLVSKLVSLSI